VARIRTDGGNHDRAVWLVALFVVVGVLVPTASVLWFMNQAAKDQATLARQNLQDAYRGQLRLICDKVSAYWSQRMAALDASSGSGTPADFKRIITTRLADSAILLDRSGSVVYPSQASPDAGRSINIAEWLAEDARLSNRDEMANAARKYARIADAESDPSLAAQAAQAQVRCLVRSGDTEAAVRAIQQHFTTGRRIRGTDRRGRLIAADEQLLALQLVKPDDPRRVAAADCLTNLLDNYDGVTMPAAQRLFLMDELLAQTSGSKPPDLPTYTAERIAAQMLDGGTIRPGNHVMQDAGVAGLWKLTSPNGRVVALYRTESVLAAMRQLFGDPPVSGARFVITAPGGGGTEDYVPAGSVLPGWQLSLTGLDASAFGRMAQRRITFYLWMGYLAVAAIAITGFIVGRSFRRELRLAHLKSDLVSTVSHELKNPLSSMQVLVDALLDDPHPEAQKTREYLELIARENARLSRLIENFLTFSRLERRRQTFDFVDTQPASVVQSAVAAARERMVLPAGHLEVAVTPDLPLVHADESALVTALLNLLDNAYKYTPSDKRISVSAYRRDGHVIFEVRDNGIGIAAGEQKKIFRRFYQVDRRLAREVGGCGLGLSIVEHIAHAHGGTVQVKSQPGVGSTFSLILPCARAKGTRA
jgi:signal transduction histidine kinase